MQISTHLSSAITVLATILITLATAAAPICEPKANGWVLIDDSPAINDAIVQCREGGTIIMRDDYYSIRSPIDLSRCNNCNFEIEGTLVIARANWTYWSSVEHFFIIANTTRLRMHSTTGKGVIDGNAVDYYTRSGWAPSSKTTALIDITNSSSEITVENLLIKNAMQRFFVLHGNSTNLRFNNLSLTTEMQNPIFAEWDTWGFSMSSVDNVKISNVTMDFRTGPSSNTPFGTCITFSDGTNDVHVDNVSCRKAWGGALIQFGSGSNNTVSNVVVSNFDFEGYHATGMQSWWYGVTHYVRNVTWDRVMVKSGKAVEFFPCYSPALQTGALPLCYGKAAYNATDVWFKHYRGNLSSMPTDPNWASLNNGTLLDSHFVDWQNGTGSDV